MQIHELAQQIRADGVQERTNKYDSFEAGQLLDDCADHEYKLSNGSFSKTEQGYAYFELDDILDSDNHPGRINLVEVRYASDMGFHTRVGNIIRRLGRETSTAVVSVYSLNETKGTRLMPEDERWGTIVGCVRDAVEECKAIKATNASKLTTPVKQAN